jgi:hypothetical protein
MNQKKLMSMSHREVIIRLHHTRLEAGEEEPAGKVVIRCNLEQELLKLLVHHLRQYYRLLLSFHTRLRNVAI